MLPHAATDAQPSPLAEQRFVLPADDNSTPPHIALEVALTSGGIDKLAVYSGLDVREVWFWDGRRFTLRGLEGTHYLVLDRSKLLPELDHALLASFIGQPDRLESKAEQPTMEPP